MLTNKLQQKLQSLTFNNTLCHGLMGIYLLCTDGTITTEEDFENWFRSMIQELGLVVEVDYRFRWPSINDVFVKGHVGLSMVMLANNAIGEFARQYTRQLADELAQESHH